MKLRHSLRFRIVSAFTFSGALLGLVFGGVVYGFLHDIEDKVLSNMLNREYALYRERARLDRQTPLPQNTFLKSFLGLAKVPEALQRRVTGLDPGMYEVENEFHVLIADLPGMADHLYMFQGGWGLEPLDGTSMAEILLGGILIVTVLSGWLGYLIAKRMIAPVINLAGQVERAAPNQLPFHIEGSFYDDEVGLLAGRLQQSINRIAEYVEREQRFTRDASHELRSPVTVVKGAAELVAVLARSGKPLDAPLRRIHRAVRDMENIIETFLYLGRQGSLPSRENLCFIEPVIENVIHQNHYLLEEKAVTTRFEPHADFAVNAPAPVVSIVIGNLIRNAFQYTEHGEIVVATHGRRLEVRDTGRGMSEPVLNRVMKREFRGGEGSGFGLGLSIVDDFCTRYGWELGIESAPGMGTRIVLFFGAEPIAN